VAGRPRWGVLWSRPPAPREAFFSGHGFPAGRKEAENGVRVRLGPGRLEKECLKLVFATLWQASERWRRIRFSEHERRQLQRYREERQSRRQRPDCQERKATVA